MTLAYVYAIQFVVTDLPILSSVFPNLLDLTNFSKKMENELDTDLTEFSKTRNTLLDQRKLADSESIEGSKTYDQSQIVHIATEFSNNKANHATKNSNSDEKRRRERDLNSVVILEETSQYMIKDPNFKLYYDIKRWYLWYTWDHNCIRINVTPGLGLKSTSFGCGFQPNIHCNLVYA